MSGFSGESTKLSKAAGLPTQDSVYTCGLCLLSLDGARVRGLSTLIILRYLMANIHDGLPPHEKRKPYEVFDLIGGTSTGGQGRPSYFATL
ncbi:uncharacterized protein RCO7_08074 [Rhynchosporium graminicola]|uniref:PNPLA domain-containing protein n=1 Tax=Rhynchosporium graminicola TaxID=2792576 RepID=A0A1E1K747_9HELO|nr:uncharacterized protein RCO7_08074 [Rhynchosporium commune]